MHESLDEIEFLIICNRVTVLDLRQNLVLAQYLEKMDRLRPNFVYTLSLTRSTLVCKSLLFANLQQSYGPCLMSEFCFCSIS